jgi:hypothetical protein
MLAPPPHSLAGSPVVPWILLTDMLNTVPLQAGADDPFEKLNDMKPIAIMAVDRLGPARLHDALPDLNGSLRRCNVAALIPMVVQSSIS